MSDTTTALDDQQAEAENVKPVLRFRDQEFTLPAKPTARFFYRAEKQELMQAFEALLGPQQFERFLTLDPEPDMDDMEAAYQQVAKVYGFGDAGN